MDECDEVAAIMLPKYLVWVASLPWPLQGHSSEKIRKWVLEKLRATESYVVIDNVTTELKRLVLQHCGGTYTTFLQGK